MRLTAIALLAALAVTPVLVATPAFAGDPIPATQAAQHVGETVTVMGVLSGYRYRGSKRPTFWNIDGTYPNQALTAVIFAEDTGKFPNMKPVLGKTIMITGTIQLNEGKPEIILKDISQVQVAQ